MQKNLYKYLNNIKEKDGFTISKGYFSAGRRVHLHWHEYIELDVIISGRLEHVYNGDTYMLEAGSTYMMCQYDYHGITALTDVEYYSIHFTKDFLDPEIAQYLNFHKFHCKLDSVELSNVLQRIELLFHEKELTLPFREKLLKNYISEIVITLIRKSNYDILHAASVPIQKALSYVNEHFLEDISLEDLAAYMSFSSNYMGFLFKTEIGCSFHEHLNILRLKYACRMLLTTDKAVKEIAFETGYHSVEYFQYIFKKIMRITPNQYRTKNTLCEKQMALSE